MAKKKKSTATASPKPVKQDQPVDDAWPVVAALPKPNRPKPPRPTGMIDPIPVAKRKVSTTRRRPSAARADVPSRGYNYTDASYTGATPQARAREVDQAQMAAQATRKSEINAPKREPTIRIGAAKRNEYAPPGLVKSDKITGTSSAKVRQKKAGFGTPVSVRPPKKK